MKEFVRKARKTLKHYFDMRFSTIAGTLVYFLLMSLAPFIVWLSLIFGRHVDLHQIFYASVFKPLSPVLNYLESSARSAASGAGIILLLTSLYSSTNFFYHLRRSGEIIYGSARVKEGLKLRVISIALIILTILATAFLAAFTVVGRAIMLYFMPEVLCNIISMIFAVVIAFAIVVLLNLFACPYKISVAQVISGSVLTTLLWVVFAVGFIVYLQFGSPGKLYGAIASVIVFLLWFYYIMCCFVIGMIKNGSDMKTRQYKKLF